jgi:16S rRNA G1207 methylase RsmC
MLLSTVTDLLSTIANAPASDAASTALQLRWTESGQAHDARWRSERGAMPPVRVVVADDSMPADLAYRLACEGTGLLWRGDFQNARLLLQAMSRRADKPPRRLRMKPAAVDALQSFHLYRQARAQRARVLGMLLVEFEPNYRIALRRAPDVSVACREAWGEADNHASSTSVASLRELLGLVSAHEWRMKGVAISALGSPPDNRIHPHYGVFSPLRGEYIDLLATALRDRAAHAGQLGFDIGTGTGVLAAVMLRGGIACVVATDMNPRALACAAENLARLGLAGAAEVLRCDLFPPGRAALIVCNPPWLPARAASPIEQAVYDEGSRMLLGFLNGLAAHLSEGGEGWLILSDLAEHLGLRTRANLLAAFADAGLEVAGRLDASAQHPKAFDEGDALHAARSLEVTSLWRLVPA